MKKCSKCGQVKEDEDFYVQKTGRRKGHLTSWCKSCCQERSRNRWATQHDKCVEEHRSWVARNKDKVAFSKVRSAYGITKEQYETMPRVCQICGSTEHLVIDHSHRSGRVRGFLCDSCNKGLGFFGDNPALLERASDYVLGVAGEIKPDIFEQTYDEVQEFVTCRVDSLSPIDGVECPHCGADFRVVLIDADDGILQSDDEGDCLPRFCPICGERL